MGHSHRPYLVVCLVFAATLASCGKGKAPESPVSDLGSDAEKIADTQPRGAEPASALRPPPAPRCVPTAAGKHCTCQTGYAPSADGTTCEDVDECQDSKGGCAGTCTNTQGGFACACPADKALGQDGKICFDPTPAAQGTTVTHGATKDELAAAYAAWQPKLPPNKIEVTPAPGVHVIDQKKQNDVVVSPGALRFNAAEHSDVLSWEKGKVVVSGFAEAGARGMNPFGFARKVERVEQVGDEIVVTTKAAALQEVLHGQFQLEFDLGAGREVTLDELKANAAWAADSLYTNTMQTVDDYPMALRKDAPPVAPTPGHQPGDPCCGWDTLVSKVKAVKASVVTKVDAAITVVTDAGKAGKAAAGAVVDKTKAAAGAVVDKTKEAAGAVVDKTKEVGGAVVDAGKAAGATVVEAATGVGTAVTTATGKVKSISEAVYEQAKSVYQLVMPQSFDFSASMSPGFDFSVFEVPIVNYEFSKTLNETGKYPIEAGFKADSKLKGTLKFEPKLSVGAKIPNPAALGEAQPLQVWLDIDGRFEASLSFDLDLEGSITSANGSTGSELEKAINEETPEATVAGEIINAFRDEVLGDEDTQSTGTWKKTVFLTKPTVAMTMVGPIPMVMTGTFQVDVDCCFDLTAGVDVEAKLSTVRTFNYRALYQQGADMVPSTPTFTSENSAEIKALGGGQASLACSLTPRVNVYLYDSIGLFAGVRATATAQAKYESTCAAKTTRPNGNLSFNLSAGVGLPVGARLQAPGSSWGGTAAQDVGIDIGPVEIWSKTFPVFEKSFSVPGLGYCAPTCTNGSTSDTESETDVDCGGQCPTGCAADKKCKVNSDCQLGLYCNAGVCAANHCNDGVVSGNETGLDCGGPTCAPCGEGQLCLRDRDCTAGACKHGVLDLKPRAERLPIGTCVADPCTDAEKSPGECDIDCGGKCPLCRDGSNCALSNVCLSGQSNGYQCVTVCDNLKADGGETDVDCGGATACVRCAAGKVCKASSDCVPSAPLCTNGVCSAPTSCGGFGEFCCADNKCGTEALTCQGTTCRCPADRGIYCGGVCCATGELCQAGACVAPAPSCLEFPTAVHGTCTAGACPASCRAQLQADPNSASGVYTIQPDPAKDPFQVRCDMAHDGGGWTLVGFESAGSPAGTSSGAMASLFKETGTPDGVATGAASGFIGPRFSFAKGDYSHLRLNWCDPTANKNVYQSFRTTEELFADGQRAANGTIVLSEFQSNDSDLNAQIPTPNSARFCRARTSTLLPGDTSWGVKGADEQNFGCGCNSGGWAGVGSYYGGTGNGGTGDQCTSCNCWGGGWAGTAGNGVPKGSINKHLFYFWVR